MLKKLAVLALGVVLCFGVSVGCGGKKADSTDGSGASSTDGGGDGASSTEGEKK